MFYPPTPSPPLLLHGDSFWLVFFFLILILNGIKARHDDIPPEFDVLAEFDAPHRNNEDPMIDVHDEIPDDVLALLAPPVKERIERVCCGGRLYMYIII